MKSKTCDVIYEDSLSNLIYYVCDFVSKVAASKSGKTAIGKIINIAIKKIATSRNLGCRY